MDNILNRKIIFLDHLTILHVVGRFEVMKEGDHHCQRTAHDSQDNRIAHAEIIMREALIAPARLQCRL